MMAKTTGTDPRQQASANNLAAAGYAIHRDGSVLIALRWNDYRLINIDGTVKRALGASK